MKCPLIVLFLINMMGCATPSQYFDQVAIELGFSFEIVSTARFKHKIFASEHLVKGETLHVYIDGDGTPWERNSWIANDPTARTPLILYLMKQDKEPAILLGRPCYYGLNLSLECDSKYWTSHRYSLDVIDSMSSALQSWLVKHYYNEVVLIGYSGGGSVAVLMADNIQKIKKVVTVAANLDVRRWSEHHGYSALKDSLNPVDEVDIKPAVQQFHFAGENDEVVPAFIIRDYAKSQRNTHFYELPGNNHSCCWEDEWMKVLEIIKQ